MVIKDYPYQSCFAPYIEALILQKRQAGFLYVTEEYNLKHFDAFCIEHSVTLPVITRELSLAWGTPRNSEAKTTCSHRISILRQLSLYMQSQGMDAYIPTRFHKKSNVVAHVLSDEEIIAFFKEADNYHPELNATVFMRLSMEYRVLFRVIYCCGLRISEARKLKNGDIDLKEGAIRIKQAKGRKDRLVYLPPDLMELCQQYKTLMDFVYHVTSIWFFPARNPECILSVSTIDLKFRQFWTNTPFATVCDRTPTVHSLRHSFVVKRMNLWMERGIPLGVMMPYLSKYLGHCSPDDTFYYYHQIQESFRIVRDKDTSSLKIIPEVRTYEE
ncbi:tyrosine-type recombinase/integrase [Clostridium boliviensis]|uniref:Tyrosine-type recombinase/integrase n=1 Tax=Clostridium boliviensis TaxID=318465 RepID=A0ABU4GPV6_9CLOT|nr:tyrosine-type recombinase/integrase [Clostridium boliviensis]MDW2799667.1 tyrosine-type recombinase/integrase [Clostridium boliviensis]